MTKPPAQIVAKWVGGREWEAGRPGGATIHIGGGLEKGPGPVDTLCCALAACTSWDVLDILEKRRTPATGLEVEVVGERADAVPARLVKLHLVFRITGDGIAREQAERACELSVTRYCSVKESLDPAIPVTWEVVLA